MLNQYLYLFTWFTKAWLLKRHAPLQTVLFITDYCNLRCKHCTSSAHGATTMKKYDTIREELEYAFAQGSRFVDLEGGEPTLWRDGDYRLNDIVSLAKKIGFFSVTVTTNGQQSIKGCAADSIWVSVDGYKDYHDAIRGEGAFNNLDKAIRESGHPALSINMAINRLNRDSVADTINYAKNNPAIKSISLNFHTPYPGTEELMLPWEERCRVIDEIISFKKQGYPIMNSYSGLKTMKRRDFKKDCWVSNFILVDGTRLSECPGKTLNICDSCGFCMAGEMYSVLRLKPDTIFSGLSLRMK
jgi:MoaA/NifB/PqqE/SkfB family radical SAM enzyme